MRICPGADQSLSPGADRALMMMIQVPRSRLAFEPCNTLIYNASVFANDGVYY